MFGVCSRRQTNLQRPLQPGRKLGDNHAHLLAHRHIGLAGPEQDPSGLDQLRHPLPIKLEPAFVVDAPDADASGYQIGRQRALLVLAHRLPVEVQALDESLALTRVVLLEPDPEERRLDPGEAAPQVVGTGEGEPQDEVRVVVLLPLRVQSRRVGAVGRQRQVLVQEGLDVRARLGGRLVAERAGFELGEDFCALC